jgi:hypothetical protein
MVGQQEIIWFLVAKSLHANTRNSSSARVRSVRFAYGTGHKLALCRLQWTETDSYPQARFWIGCAWPTEGNDLAASRRKNRWSAGNKLV